MIDKKELSKIRKNARASGIRFELRVREDLIKKGWIVDKWTNNLDYPKRNINIPPEEREDMRLVPAKPKFVFNPRLKMRVMIGNSSGFPDFVAFTKPETVSALYGGVKLVQKIGQREVIGVESKSNGILDKIERAKCEWLLKNNIFSRILVAQKGKKRGEIIYTEFQGGKMEDNKMPDLVDEAVKEAEEEAREAESEEDSE